MSDAEQVARAWSALGRQLAACRRAAGLSQERLAALADYSRSTIANVETGRQQDRRRLLGQVRRGSRCGRRARARIRRGAGG